MTGPDTARTTSGGAPDAGGLVSRLRAWAMAARPQTLPAGASPVLVGTGAAIGARAFHAGASLAALVGALLIQDRDQLCQRLLRRPSRRRHAGPGRL